MKKYAIHIFRRDLRIYDNHTLYHTSKIVDYIIPIFIFDVKQIIKNEQNQYYYSECAVQFLCESLIDLNQQLSLQKSKLQLFFGEPHKVIKTIIDTLKIFPENLFISFQKDYSPYALERDNAIKKLFKPENILEYENDLSLVDIHLLCKKNSQAYKQFGAFYKNVSKLPINQINANKNIKFHNINILNTFDIENVHTFYSENNSIAQNGGRKYALDILKNINKFKNYEQNHNLLSYQTTQLSAYLNFGCVSIREVYNITLTNIDSLKKQLRWRDFFLQALIYLPNGNQFEYLDKRYSLLKWKNNEQDWTRLLDAKTGFLIVDAGINQMKQTGFMHNRARMIVGTFWIKYLLIDVFHKKYGSQVGYSKYLIDAVGPSQNKFNHQWLIEFDYAGRQFAPKGISLAGRPMDVSNKIIQKFDPDGTYVKKWIPELKNIPIHDIIHWNNETYKKYKVHVPPMFDSKLKYQQWIDLCKQIQSK